jgi:hypothetical protein
MRSTSVRTSPARASAPSVCGAILAASFLAPVASAQVQYPITPQATEAPAVAPSRAASPSTEAPPSSAILVKSAGASAAAPAPARVLSEQTQAGDLVLTGSNATVPLVAAGAAAVASGFVLVAAARRRQQAGTQ